ncbi:MAG: winged helix-turn-helix domain-containing protein [Candidatus Gastranaerophilales bacterium]|nr:winged helix-turn-helix domain-containing protein [Elusimicrobiaceae bacterium]MBR6299164.1 winged helix-turn-helix domain-containing protein [Candidatus Gastranaerophilales bacterium]
MQKTIIETAGRIWEYLNENGEVTTKKMNKDLGLSDNFTNLGLGWLAREDKVNFSRKGSYTKISLR